ncbi:calcineurin-like phosphoesterase [Tetraselmis virus 1]|uniref:Calcineurin-like phosphoesterase n=1 Tax=Tetraselmis virus 1 TaxID=2060617 RepID=A0A2P0VNJ6_9VIRU|nr:calcineurin-like phosphoesterase [Tetraselmis virus 1]AUF82472.1 calcineurin-like phosphoesterase [Tetraselmis virus 1]
MYSYLKTVPTEIESESRIIVVPDVHSDLKKAKECLRLAGVLNRKDEWVGGNTIVVQIGDQVDGGERGPVVKRKEHVCNLATKRDVSVIRFFNKLHNKAIEDGGAVYCIVGNHEMMNVYGDFRYAGIDDCEKCARVRGLAFQKGGAVARILATTRNIYIKIGRIVFVHAGFLPWHLKAMGMQPHRINNTFTNMLLGNPVSQIDQAVFDRVTMDMQGILTNRSYTPDRHISVVEVDEVLDYLDADHMIIGHNAHQQGITPLHGGRVWVVDPGMSYSVMNSEAAILEITPRENLSLQVSHPQRRHSFRVMNA